MCGVLLLAGLALVPGCSPDTTSAPLENILVEAACGQCQFALAGKGCDLAVRIDGQAYFVDGTGLDDHGDAHAADGFCNAVRQARVSGRIQGERFHATAFELQAVAPPR